MLNSKFLFLSFYLFFPISALSKVPQLNSTQLGAYANQLNDSAQPTPINHNNSAFSNVAYNQTKVLPQAAYKNTSYSHSSDSNSSAEQTGVHSVDNNSNWVVDLIKSKKAQQINFSSFSQNAAQPYQAQSGRKATLNCVIQAARNEGVPLFVLLGIQSKERGENGQINASNDLGHFQINTQHFKSGGMFSNIDMNLARNDGCLNATLAAKVLRSRLQSNMSIDFWTKAAAYHSWTPHLNAVYRNGTSKNKGLIEYSMQWKKWLELNGINPN
ncbi:transglycosylase SLT domain-containing protein [Acinetobacter gyllenbergii]|uniref:transglycosylase SLT domain-containing protein n=1 Tax=Acinetobacter gyllenbergii TaxID=134534 RepID=UPI003F54CE65